MSPSVHRTRLDVLIASWTLSGWQNCIRSA